MGWSARADACETVDAWTRACVAQTGQQNVYQTFDSDARYFYEIGREQADGSITGSVFRFVDETHVRRAGSFKIGPDGNVIRWPAGFRKFWEQEGAHMAQRATSTALYGNEHADA